MFSLQYADRGRLSENITGWLAMARGWFVSKFNLSLFIIGILFNYVLEIFAFKYRIKQQLCSFLNTECFCEHLSDLQLVFDKVSC